MSKTTSKGVLFLSTCLLLSGSYLSTADAGKLSSSLGGLGISANGGSANGGGVSQSQSNGFSNTGGQSSSSGGALSSLSGGGGGGKTGGGGGNAIASGNNAQVGIGGDGGKGGDGGFALGGSGSGVSANGGSANGGSVRQNQENSFANNGGNSILSGNNAQVGIAGDGGEGGDGGYAIGGFGGSKGKPHGSKGSKKWVAGKHVPNSQGQEHGSWVSANGGSADGGSVKQHQSNSFTNTGKAPDWQPHPPMQMLSSMGPPKDPKPPKGGEWNQGKAFASGNNLQYGRGGDGGKGGSGGFALGKGVGAVSANGGSANGGSVKQHQGNTFTNDGGYALLSGNNAQIGVGGDGGEGGDGGVAVGLPGHGMQDWHGPKEHTKDHSKEMAGHTPWKGHKDTQDGNPKHEPQMTPQEATQVLSMFDDNQRLQLVKGCGKVLDNPAGYASSVREICVFAAK